MGQQHSRERQHGSPFGCYRRRKLTMQQAGAGVCMRSAYMKGIKNTHLPVVLAFFLIAFSSPAARSQSTSTDMQRLPAGAEVDLIVQYKHKPSDADHSIAKSLGAKKRKELALIKASSYR